MRSPSSLQAQVPNNQLAKQANEADALTKMIQARTYQFGPSQLSIRFGNIVTAEAQVIVSSDDHYITMGSGVSAAILRAGGGAIPLDARKKVPAALGDVVVTTAGALKAQYVFHAITIGPNPDNLSH